MPVYETTVKVCNHLKKYINLFPFYEIQLYCELEECSYSLMRLVTALIMHSSPCVIPNCTICFVHLEVNNRSQNVVDCLEATRLMDQSRDRFPGN